MARLVASRSFETPAAQAPQDDGTDSDPRLHQPSPQKSCAFAGTNSDLTELATSGAAESQPGGAGVNAADRLLLRTDDRYSIFRCGWCYQ
ncbi:hypothetical protein JQ633_25930 [Bradyrhizobium tropiciagri]|nr:hypothetical protein [Bradyrhizobium tropiciagri]